VFLAGEARMKIDFSWLMGLEDRHGRRDAVYIRAYGNLSGE
jgi:hypothetical protein